MRRVAYLACCVGALGLLGCGGNKADDDDDTVDSAVYDTNLNPDGDTPPGCNPVAQTGCQPSEKCTWIVDSAGPPLLAYTGCTADGDKGAGQACTSPEVGADDCVAGYYCLNSECAEICGTSPNTCPTDYYCSVYTAVFDDAENTGMCNAGCDPVTQNCSNASQGCYVQVSTGEASCAGVPGDAAALTQGMGCLAECPAGSCCLNGCAKGYGLNFALDTCSFFCNPIDNYLNNVNGLTGDPAGITCEATFGGERPDGPGPSYECRFIQSYYSGAEENAATWGMAVDPEGEDGVGSCEEYDFLKLVDDINSGAADAADYCDNNPQCCGHYGCVSNATWDEHLPPAFRSVEGRYECYQAHPALREGCGNYFYR